MKPTHKVELVVGTDIFDKHKLELISLIIKSILFQYTINQNLDVDILWLNLELKYIHHIQKKT